MLHAKEHPKHDIHVYKRASTTWGCLLLHPSEDREELDKLLHTSDVISMHLLSIEFDSELLMMSACSIWLHSMTRLEYAIGLNLFCV
jgi:hypothetical protein